MDDFSARTLTHPAAAELRRAAADERRALVRALAIEADWRFHDGPEWAARYWAAFGDLRRDAGTAPDMRVAAAAAQSRRYPALTAMACAQTRAMFRALLAALHPQVAPASTAADRAGLWSLSLCAYRAGDTARLRALLERARPHAATARLPRGIVALRAEHERLCAARGYADRRLAELAQSFPFNLRDALADADWVRRQRIALRQIMVMTGNSRPDARGKRVS